MSELTTAPPPDQTAQQLFSPVMDETELQKHLQIQVIDVSHGVQNEAIDQADSFINAETTQSGFKGMLKRIWTGNLAHEYIRLREVTQNKQDIVESGNIYNLLDASGQQHDQAMTAIVSRFSEQLPLLSGESSGSMAESESGRTLMDQLRTLVTEFAGNPDSSHEELEESKVRILSEYGKGKHADDRNKGLLFADNITEVAATAKAAVAHGLGLDRIDALLSGKQGEAKMGAQTEARRNLSDKVLDKLYKHKPGTLVNETSLALAVGVVATIAKFTTRKAVTAAGATVGLGVGAGLIAGAREHARVSQDRAAHMRERATGSEMPAPGAVAKRREQIEETRYETVAVSDVLDRLAQARSAVDEADPLTAASLLTTLAELETRSKLSDEESIDLIQYSSKTNLEQERLDVMRSIAEAKIALRRVGIGDDIISERSELVLEALRTDVSDKDQAFRKIQRSRTLKMAAIGMVGGVIIGEGIQEIKALVSDELQGVFESGGSGEQRRTLLAAIFKGHHNTSQHPSNSGHEAKLTNNLSVGVPAGYHTQEVSPGHWSLVGPDNNQVVDNIGFDANGNLDPAAVSSLEHSGVQATTHTENYTTTRSVSELASRTPSEYLQVHPDKFTTVHRELWYGNDTPNAYDQNELKLDWGGNEGTGMDANGNFVFNVQHMMANGSFENGNSANAQQLIHEGKMVMALSMDRTSQSHVLMVPIDAEGNAHISAQSWEGRSMFENKDGQAHFVGAYAEAAQMMGPHPNGGETIRTLATVVGENHAHAAADRVTHVVTATHLRTIAELSVTQPESLPPVEVPIPLPIYGRRGLESLVSADNRTAPETRPKFNPEDPEFGGIYYGGSSLKEIQNWIREDPSRLQARQLINNPDGTKLWVEADGTPVERNVERERATISQYLDRQEAISPRHFAKVTEVADFMAPMNDGCRVVVNVPAWLEAKNLSGFLNQYTSQINTDGSPLDPNIYEINVLVNRKTGSAADDSVTVITDFITEFENRSGFRPNVNYFDIEIDPPLNNVGYARKLLTDAVLMRSQRRQNQTAALYVESEDADLVRLDLRTVTNLIQKLDAKPHLDAVRGLVDRSPEYLKDNELLFLNRRVWDFAEILARNKSFRDPTSPSWNYQWNRNWMNGWNAGYSAEAYALIGGYDSVTVGEDMRLGEKITMIRGNGDLPNLEVISNVGSKSDGSPRRFIAEILRNTPAYSNDFSNEELNIELRERSITDLMDGIKEFERITPENKEIFDGILSGYSQFIKSVTPDDTSAQHTMQRLMHMLGFKPQDYSIVKGDEGDKIVVGTWDNVTAALHRYRNRLDPQTPIERFNRLQPLALT